MTYHLAECLQLSQRRLTDVQGEQHRLADDLPQAYSIVGRRLYHFIKRRLPYATRRIVDNTLEGLLVIRVGNKTKVGYHILDFLTLIERQSTVDTVGNAVLTHLLLKTPTLRVRAVQDGKVRIAAAVLTPDTLDVLADDNSLFLVTICRFQQQPLSLLILAIHLLGNLPFILSDERVGRLHDELCRTIVLF